MEKKKDALKDYVEVNVRIEKFYDKFPNGRIITDLVSWNDGVVVMKATVYRSMDDPNEKPSATGYAYEKEGSTFINKTSALENCETSAVGRALAMLGFEIKKSIASKEEVANAKLNQDESRKTILIAKWKTLNYPPEKFDDWYKGQQEKGYTEQQMEVYLTKKLKEVKVS